MLLLEKLNLLPYINLIHIICSVERPEYLRDVDTEVWKLARKHEEVPNFQRIFAVVICGKLKDAILNRYKDLDLSVDFYLNYDEPHFFVNHSEVYSLDDLNRIIAGIEGNSKSDWQPDYELAFSEYDTLGIKIHKSDMVVEYSYGHEQNYKNPQKTKILEGYFDSNGKLTDQNSNTKLNSESELYFKINDVDAIFRINTFEKNEK